MADMIVSGAGWTAANGTYAEYGTLGGKPRYRMASAGSESGYIYIEWVWDMYREVNNWGISTNSEDPFSCRYFSADDVATPDLVATWVFSPYGMQIPPFQPSPPRHPAQPMKAKYLFHRLVIYELRKLNN